MDMAEDVPAARPAATVVVFRRSMDGGPPEILLLERSGAMAFAGGATVFPGGAVDAADRVLAATTPGAELLDPDDAAARVAAVREALEESGLVVGVKGAVTAPRAIAARQRLLAGEGLGTILADEGWAIDFDSLVPFARWWPRHREIRVFDTRFYLADVGTGALDLVVDATENRHLFWASAQEALRLADAGRIKVIFPTRRNLERLALWPDFASARTHALATEIRIISPWQEMREGVPWLVIPADAGYPVDGEPLGNAMRG
ncbi:NUDIX domain-containing protein [Novosphingobium sp. FSW06-99]|uniref:NUDIX domain-containing protein n=1 Tax=Novosphingobium sp. FSW06-99 TaxID=1739113 RepID=UPI000AEFBBD1|nr:NUDIX domain-containing protein [Novosphingobium sp. FSW06-99]